MQRTFITNLALLLFVNVLVKPFWILGIDRSVQNAVGAEDYGLYYALFSFSYLLNILLDVGITNFNNRNIAQNEQLLTKHFSSVATLKWLLGGVYLIATIIAGFLVGYEGRVMQFLLFLCINQFLLSFILYLRSNLAGMHLFRQDSVMSVLDRTIMIGLCSALLWGNFTDQAFNIWWFIVAQTVSYALAALVGLVLVLRKTTSFRPRLNLPFSLMILKKSLPFATLILFMTFYYRVDAVMIERMLEDGKEQAGIYAQAFRLLDAVQMIGYLFAGLLLPLFSRMLKQREPVADLVALASRLLMAAGLVVATTAFFYRTELMALLYTEHAAQSAPIFVLLMAAFVPMASTYVFGTLLTANDNLKALNIMALGGMALNICLNAVLIPEYGALGAAFASLTTQLLTAAVQVALAQFIFRFRVNWALIVSLISFALALAGSGWLLQQSGMEWRLTLVILLATALVLSIATRLVRPKIALELLTANRS